MHKARAGHIVFQEKFPGKMRLCQKNIQDLVKGFSASCTPIPTLRLSCRAPLQVWDLFFFGGGGFGRLVLLRITKTLSNPLRRPPEHLLGSRCQIRVTTQGRNHKNAEYGAARGGGKKSPLVFLMGEHMEKGVAEPASSFWDARRRKGRLFSCKEGAQ